MDIKLDPVESFVFDGLAQQCSRVFGCPAVSGGTADKVQMLERITSGQVKYPYIFLNIQRLTYNAESYSTNRMSRTGLKCLVNADSGMIYQVRLVPTNFEVEVQFICNSMDPRKPGSLIEFQKRWLLAYRAGHLKYQINYGDLTLRIGCTLAESVDVPQLENKTEQPAHYECNATLTVHGYVGDPHLKNVGVVKQVDIQDILGVNATFVPFRS